MAEDTKDEAVALGSLSLKQVMERDDSGFLPIHFAVHSGGPLQVIQEILKVNPDCINDQENKHRHSPLMWAVRSQHPTFIQQLIEQHNADVTLTDSDGYNALLHAAQYGNTLVVHLLTLYGCSLDQTDSSGHNALHWAIYSGHARTVQYLLARGMNPNVTDQINRNGFHWAAYKGNLDILYTLLSHHATSPQLYQQIISTVDSKNHNLQYYLNDLEDEEVRFLGRKMILRFRPATAQQQDRTFLLRTALMTSLLALFILCVCCWPMLTGIMWLGILVLYAGLIVSLYHEVRDVLLPSYSDRYDPFPLSVLLSFASVSCVTFYGYVIPKYFHLFPLATSVMAVSGLIMAEAFRRVTFTSARVIPKGTHPHYDIRRNSPSSFCASCLCVKPLRSKHCSACGHCVERFDHHCPYVGRDVGRGNHHYFFTFTGVAVMQYFFGTILFIAYVSTVCSEAGESLWKCYPEHSVIFGMIPFHIGYCGFVATLLYTSLPAVFQGITVNELYNAQRFHYVLDEPPPSNRWKRTPWSTGLISNLKELLPSDGARQEDMASDETKHRV